MYKCIILLLLVPTLLSAQPNDFPIYSMSSVGYGDSLTITYIPLTERYSFYDFAEEEPVIATEYLGYADIKNENYHVLSPIKRHLFLDRIEIDAGDLVFVYNIKRDTVYKLRLADIPLVAFLTPYGSEKPIPESDYIVALHLTQALKDNYPQELSNYNNFVYLGSENPFVTGALQQITWVPTDSTSFPEVVLDDWEKRLYTFYKPTTYFYFKTEHHTYYLKNFGSKNNTNMRHLAVVKSSTNQVVLSRTYRNSEGSYLKPISKDEEGYGYEGGQLTGLLFRSLPPVIFGFAGYSFGCEQIDLLDPEAVTISIRCDNRH